MDVLIRLWQREDFPAVRRILWESWTAAYSSFIPERDLRAFFTATYREDMLARLWENPLIHVWIGLADGEAVGMARVQYHRNENRLYLASLYLLPSHQGRGIGGRLLRAAEGKARDCGLPELWVGVMTPNAAARHWYEGRGFRFVREAPFRMGETTVGHRIGFKMIREPRMEAALQRRLQAVYPSAGAGAPLAGLAGGLLARQKARWPLLASGTEALAAARIREIDGGGWRVKVQFNPQRIVSSGARTDPEAVRQRPCFLCLENLPAPQEAILYRDAYLILANPAPLFPGHLTIAHTHHLPQSLPENLGLFLRLAADFGPGIVILYNGPRCGASAPDHLHFQAVPAGCLPVEAEAADPRCLEGERRLCGAVVRRTQGLGRGCVVIEGRERAAVVAAVGAVVEALRPSESSGEEPLLNLLGAHTGDGWRLLLFPRIKHRPAAYFREGKERLLVSPGAADMGGWLVTPIEKDYQAMDRDLVQGIYNEVALDDAAAAELLERL
jgi:ribosomal protein S18 acetylase RimI-like enzyme